MKFIVNSDPQGIVYTIGIHPLDNEMALICFPGGTANYDKVDVDHYFDTGMWLKIEN